MNRKKSLVSVIVPVYNAEKYIVECLDSILAQTYTNLECLLIQDGSTDNSVEICREYADELEKLFFHPSDRIERTTGKT